jgi:hypothetical protein
MTKTEIREIIKQYQKIIYAAEKYFCDHYKDNPDWHEDSDRKPWFQEPPGIDEIRLYAYGARIDCSSPKCEGGCSGPSCGYIIRNNRKGTKFVCHSCGRQAHADWVGASGILRRSGDKSITCKDRPSDVKRKLEERFNSRWIGSLGSGRSLPSYSPLPLGRRLTTEGSGSQPTPAQPQTRNLGSEERFL